MVLTRRVELSDSQENLKLLVQVISNKTKIWTTVFRIIKIYYRVVDYLKHFNKFNSSFLRKVLDNDIILDFLRFRVPDNGIFSDQAVHSFQLRLLRSEISQANADRAKASGNLVKAREVVRRGIDEKWWPSVIIYLKWQARCSVNNLMSRHKRKLKKTFGKTG